jgi:hypothetical protein
MGDALPQAECWHSLAWWNWQTLNVYFPSSECLWWWLLRQRSDREQIVLLFVYLLSFKFYEAQIDNKACGTWLSVSDKPLSLQHLEPLNRCIFLAGSLIPYFYVFTFLYNARNKMMNASLFYFYATTASRLMGFMP